MKINWELEKTKNYLEKKGYSLKYTLGSINYTCYVYEKNTRRIEVWDDKSGELLIVDVMNRSLNIEEL